MFCHNAVLSAGKQFRTIIQNIYVNYVKLKCSFLRLTAEKSLHLLLQLKLFWLWYASGISSPVLCCETTLLGEILHIIHNYDYGTIIDPAQWINSVYKPSPEVYSRPNPFARQYTRNCWIWAVNFPVGPKIWFGFSGCVLTTERTGSSMQRTASQPEWHPQWIWSEAFWRNPNGILWFASRTRSILTKPTLLTMTRNAGWA